MGANITLLAAAKSPTLFSELILIEPVMVSRFHAFLFRYAPQSWLQKQEPVASALAAPTSWSTPELAYQHFRGHPAYKRMPDQTLKTMLKGLIDNHQGKTSLVYPKDWEIHNYLQVRPILNAFQTLKTPTVFIRGKSSLFVHDKSWQAMLRMKPDTLCFREMEYGHLLPLEAPGLTRQLIFSGLTKLRQAHSEP
ncbi:hypothetical protein GCM10022277_44940 [Litoribacillus peritrichatus]|uniref:Alpha/beta hydrolase n=2 Tax=Litoribacillus peritrichatus TaxID=718191 RepID=A0ABP7NDS7_9GAMM